MAQLVPYVSFNGNTLEAMNFYKDCLGGKLEITKVSDMPAMAEQCPPHLKDSILHSSLVADGITIFATDMSRAKHEEGTAFNFCLVCKDEAELDTLFEKLSAGGTIMEQPKPMPWGDYFGALTDKFGKGWMFDCSKEEGKNFA